MLCTHCILHTAYHMHTACCLLHTAYCLRILHTAYCMLHTAYRILLLQSWPCTYSRCKTMRYRMPVCNTQHGWLWRLDGTSQHVTHQPCGPPASLHLQRFLSPDDAAWPWAGRQQRRPSRVVSRPRAVQTPSPPPPLLAPQRPTPPLLGPGVAAQGAKAPPTGQPPASEAPGGRVGASGSAAAMAPARLALGRRRYLRGRGARARGCAGVPTAGGCGVRLARGSAAASR